jgi:hypothetical protein
MNMAKTERGAALIGAILLMLVLSMMGTVSLNLTTQEIQSVKAAEDDAAARHLAEAGSDLVMQWFHDPRSTPEGGAGGLFAKRYELPDAGPSFFDANGASQFAGTADQPDLFYDASRPSDDRLLNDPTVGWFRPLRALGRILKLKVYGPVRPGLLCTVEVTAGTGRVMRTLSVQLKARTVPPLRSAVQIGNGGGTTGSPDSPLPVFAHWGDMKVTGDVRFGKPDEIPVKTLLASVTGQSYADMPHREDRWADIWVGGQALVVSGAGVPLPSNVYPNRDPSPGLRMDRWDYDLMKQYAWLYGSYFVPDWDGLLYRNGKVEPGLGLTPDSVFQSEAVGDHHGLVFVDTMDQRPPGPDNLGTLMLEVPYAEGIFIVNAHLNFKPKGPGRSVPVLSPPGEGAGSSGSLWTRIPVQLNGIHIQGVVYTAGDLRIEGQPRIYGALAVGGRVTGVSPTSGPLELWYNSDLRSGMVRGLPLVSIAPGTWLEQY